jgi:protocatechuate 3,4-dioxygenase beta subunit
MDEVTLEGKVTDASGQPLPGVLVVVKGNEEQWDLITNAEGRFRSPMLSPGKYEVIASMEGFQPARKETTVKPGEVVNLDFTLQVADN